MKQKAYFYEVVSGQVFRCMFEGIDHEGRAQWVIITPGEESLTLNEYREKYGIPETFFVMLCMEGEKASSRDLVKVLGCVLREAFDLKANLKGTIHQLRNFGVTWDEDPLELKVHIFCNSNTICRGKYSFSVEEVSEGQEYLFTVDNFDDLDTLNYWVDTLVNILESYAFVKVDSLGIIDETKGNSKK